MGQCIASSSERLAGLHGRLERCRSGIEVATAPRHGAVAAGIGEVGHSVGPHARGVRFSEAPARRAATPTLLLPARVGC